MSLLCDSESGAVLKAIAMSFGRQADIFAVDLGTSIHRNIRKQLK
jgi:hypothetical protein